MSQSLPDVNIWKDLQTDIVLDRVEPTSTSTFQRIPTRNWARAARIAIWRHTTMETKWSPWIIL